MSTQLNPAARKAIELARSGQRPAAIEAGFEAVAMTPDDAGLRLFLGFLLSSEMRLVEGVEQLRAAVRLNPRDELARVELARLLVGLDELDEVAGIIRPVRSGPGKDRIEALLHRRRGNHRQAEAIYRRAVQADHKDFESWGNLGVCLLALGKAAEAGECLTQSLTLRRNQPVFREKWAEAQFAAGQGEDGLLRAREFAAANPQDVLVWTIIARLELLLDRPEQSRAALYEALHRDPDDVMALLAMAELDERENRVEELVRHLDRLDALGVHPSQLQLLKARLAFREGNYREALDTADDAPGGADPGGKAHLMGLIRDRIADADGAFAAFIQMNEETAREVSAPEQEARKFRERIAGRMKTGTRKWVRSWKRIPFNEERDAPTFLIGFPRSGTTLLDTLLMGHPKVAVAEEKPMLHEVSEAMGGYVRLAELETNEVETLRALYFARAETHLGPAKGQKIIDKLPLGIIDVPLIHRLFPEARFIFVQRHPCDVVLSGFMTRFQPVGGMTNFLTLDDTVRLYDRVMAFWIHCRALLPLLVHVVRYERLVDDTEAEMRPLATFLGLKWSPRLIDHRRSARERGFIGTPSYAQVQEPINDRSIGRWERYRDQMEPVLPILRPWAEIMGYRT